MQIRKYGRDWAVYDADGTLVYVCLVQEGRVGGRAGVCQGNTDNKISGSPDSGLSSDNTDTEMRPIFDT